ncbi:MAG: hypothetical protein QF489_05735 [Planctomycetota bacterium]|jgi:hypothetical protein|nr:hypothetical protein [Planctomycetota bacterium]
MKYVFAAFLLPAIIGLSTWSTPISAAVDDPQILQNGDQQSGSNLVLIESQPNDLEGWVDIAPLGSNATRNSTDANPAGLVHLPFSASGDTKIIVNMDYVSWIFTSGTTTEIKTIGSPQLNSIQNEKSKTLLISNIKQDRLAEVYLEGSGAMIPMDGPDKYVINADLLRWAKIPDEASVSVIK